MLYSILPEWLLAIIREKYSLEMVYEVRLRLNKPIVLCIKGRYELLTKKQDYRECVVLASKELIDFVVAVATKQSLYAYNDQIKHCYITTDSGIRIGVCGSVVSLDGKVTTIKNITSLNIRVSHQATNCSDGIINFICNKNNVKNTLIISPPGAGKTTFIRDIATKLSNEKNVHNILIVDERFEIAGNFNDKNLSVGNFVDIISGSNKCYAFSEALKTMTPSVIVTDEVSEEEDIRAIEQAVKSGVKVIATAHAESIGDLKYKKYFTPLLEDKYFERIVVLSNRCGVGTVEGVFDENLRCIYLPYLS